jgi:hypothetical protein
MPQNPKKIQHVAKNPGHFASRKSFIMKVILKNPDRENCPTRCTNASAGTQGIKNNVT